MCRISQPPLTVSRNSLAASRSCWATAMERSARHHFLAWDPATEFGFDRHGRFQQRWNSRPDTRGSIVLAPVWVLVGNGDATFRPPVGVSVGTDRRFLCHRPVERLRPSRHCGRRLYHDPIWTWLCQLGLGAGQQYSVYVRLTSR